VALQQAGVVLCTSCGQRSTPRVEWSSSPRSPFNCGSSFNAVPTPTRIPSCIVRILDQRGHGVRCYHSRPSRPLSLECRAHQCVIIMLSLPLNINCFPPTPAIFASRDCANVNVTLGRSPLISISSPKVTVRKLGGSTMGSQRSVQNATKLQTGKESKATAQATYQVT